ncbi:histidine kinase [Pseudothermotoga hypogea DSM 11164 = NBRC 106472]|uniref:histidine kinase n=2 Tax=Pseudothermotoga TaxID=1643951 RepID=A0A0X1KPN2_9THEM|nr:HAMP domain-containing sensor histidine kinase [Pseudothermotoga hypogea]AJC73180.1 histidine kinase [Pseudothermotoga hypogea DSM 11164 = NBRC 106472]
MFSTLKWKLTVIQTVLFSLVLGLGLLLTYNVTKQVHISRSVALLRQAVSAYLRNPMRNAPRSGLPAGIAIISSTGEVIFGTIDTQHESFEKFLSHVLSVRKPSYIKLGNDEYLVVKLSVQTFAGQSELFLLSPAGGMGDFLKLLSRMFLILWAIFSLASFLLGHYFVNRSLAPMKRITEELRNISASDLSRRVYDPGTEDEVSNLAKTINDMLNRLQLGFEMQNDFVNDVSHELRTPLTSIQGYAELIEKFSKNSEIVTESARTIRETVQQIIDLTENLLTLSRPVSKVELVRLDLRKFLHEEAEEFSRQFRDFTFEVEGEGEGCSDTRALRIVLKALVENAVKFSTNDKRIILRCGDGWISVKDFGIGIEDSEKKKIFQKFYKSDRSRSTPGYGLGLALADKLVRAIGGTIEVVSEVGKGSEFIVKLPKC